jgi:glycosyltransferase involved in cell wall biosynthesis
MSKKISIIVPSYNSESWLPKCINSIMGQTYKNLEIIIVNNDSTDSTDTILARYVEEDRRIVVLTEQRKGTTYARNRGIDAATGDYICFIDSDDYIADTYCEKLLSKIRHYDIAVCGVSVESSGKKNTSFSCVDTTSEVSTVEFVKWIFNMAYSSHTVVNKLYKSELIKKNNIKFIEGRNYEDISYSLHTALTAERSIFINESLYIYCIRPNSRSTIVSDQNFDDYVFQFKKVRDMLINSKVLGDAINEYRYALLYALYQLNRMYIDNIGVSEKGFKENCKELLSLIYEARYYKA